MAKNESYKEFVEKFKYKKTTDDCYTPELVYEAVADWVAKEYGLDRFNFVRPFFPNGDFEKYPYKSDDVIVDNPPFSILAEIRRFYLKNNIKFFLFAPGKTIFSCLNDPEDCTAIIVSETITYSNGAKVRTAFLTNLNKTVRVRTAPSLKAALKKLHRRTVQRTAHEYPDELLTFSRLERIAEFDFEVDKSECTTKIRNLDEQRTFKTGIYGGGLLISSAKAKELKTITVGRKVMKWQLSGQEKEIIKKLDKK